MSEYRYTKTDPYRYSDKHACAIAIMLFRVLVEPIYLVFVWYISYI